jgi:hypothetical protein
MVVQGKLGADAVIANNIAAGQVSASKISVTDLDSVSTSTGALTIGTNGYIRGGQTAYDTGTGFWLGYASPYYKFSIGNQTQYMKWDGTQFLVGGDIIATGNIKSGAINNTHLPAVTAGDGIALTAPTMQRCNFGGYTKIKEFTINRTGGLRIKHVMNVSQFVTAYTRVYRNGVAVGPVYTNNYTTRTNVDDITGWSIGDKVQLYCYGDGYVVSATVTYIDPLIGSVDLD